MSACREPSSGQSFPNIHSLPRQHVLQDFQEASQRHFCAWWGFWYLCWIWDPWWWAGAGPQWTEGQILSISLGRRIWLPVPLLKNIDSLFRRRMEKILWFLFLLFREAAEEITALGGKLGWVRSKGLSALEIHGVCECISFWPLAVERRPYLSIQGRRIYRIEAGGDP